MPRSVRLYTPAQFEEVKALVDLLAGQSGLPPAERRIPGVLADVRQHRTAFSDRHRAEHNFADLDVPHLLTR